MASALKSLLPSGDLLMAAALTAPPPLPSPSRTPLETARLTIQFFDPANPSHYDNVLGLYTASFTTELWGDSGIHTAADLDARAEKIRLPAGICMRDANAVPSHQWHLCYLHETREFIAYVGTHCADHAWGPELGYRFKPEYQGQGYCTEAVVEVLRWYKEVVGLEGMTATPSVNNVASCRVVEKAGGVDRGRKGKEGGWQRKDSQGLRCYEWDWT